MRWKHLAVTLTLYEFYIISSTKSFFSLQYTEIGWLKLYTNLSYQTASRYLVRIIFCLESSFQWADKRFYVVTDGIVKRASKGEWLNGQAKQAKQSKQLPSRNLLYQLYWVRFLATAKKSRLKDFVSWLSNSQNIALLNPLFFSNLQNLLIVIHSLNDCMGTFATLKTHPIVCFLKWSSQCH